MQAARFYETSSIYTILYNVTFKKRHFHSHCRENFKLRTAVCYLTVLSLAEKLQRNDFFATKQETQPLSADEPRIYVHSLVSAFVCGKTQAWQFQWL
jgi:hypothetical protein